MSIFLTSAAMRSALSFILALASFIHEKGKICEGIELELWLLSLLVGVLGWKYLAGIYIDVKKSFILFS